MPWIVRRLIPGMIEAIFPVAMRRWIEPGRGNDWESFY